MTGCARTDVERRVLARVLEGRKRAGAEGCDDAIAVRPRGTNWPPTELKVRFFAITAGFTCSVVGPTTSVIGAATAGRAIVVSTRCTSSSVTLGCTGFTGNVTGRDARSRPRGSPPLPCRARCAMPGIGRDRDRRHAVELDAAVVPAADQRRVERGDRGAELAAVYGEHWLKWWWANSSRHRPAGVA